MKTLSIPVIADKWQLSDKGTRERLKLFTAKPSARSKTGKLLFSAAEVRRVEHDFRAREKKKLNSFGVAGARASFAEAA